MSESAETTTPRGAALDGLLERREWLRKDWGELQGLGDKHVLGRILCPRRADTHLLGVIWRTSQGALAVAIYDNETRMPSARLAQMTSIREVREEREQQGGWEEFEGDRKAVAFLDLLDVLASDELRSHSIAAGWLGCECRTWGAEVFAGIASVCAGWAGAPPRSVKRVRVSADGSVNLHKPRPRRPLGGE